MRTFICAPRDGQRLLEFGVLHPKWLAGQLQHAQSFDEANRATTFAHEQWRPNVVRRLPEDGIGCFGDTALDEDVECWLSVCCQRGRVAQFAPQDMQGRMQQLPTLFGRNTRLGDTQLTAAKAEFRVCAESTHVLQLQAARPRRQSLPCWPRNTHRVIEKLEHVGR